MADIAPLWPLRYDAALLDHVVAPPYDTVDEAMRRELAARHVYNVVHIDLPEGDGLHKYERAQALFSEWQELGVVVRDEAPAYWRYAQTFPQPGSGLPCTRKGFLALVRALPFSEQRVLSHEQTQEGPKLDRMQLSRATRAALSPQLMLYSDPEGGLESILDSAEPCTSFDTPDGTHHELSKVADPAAIAQITIAMARQSLLLVDGHHRYEAAVAISNEFEAEAKERGVVTDARSEHRFTYALLVNADEPNLFVTPTHRLVHSLPSLDWADLVTQARVLFDVELVTGRAIELQQRLLHQSRPAMCAMIRGGTGALFVLREDADLAGHPVLGRRSSVLRDTAITLLHDGLLEYVLGIGPEVQSQLAHLKYIQEPAQGEALLERGEGQLLFLLGGIAISSVRRVAEAGERLPQNATSVYPQVPTGLCFHTLYPDRMIP